MIITSAVTCLRHHMPMLFYNGDFMSKKANKKTQAKNQDQRIAPDKQGTRAKLSKQNIVFIAVAAILAVTIIVSSLLFFIPLIKDSREKNFNYLTSDLSYYLDIPEDVYKDITLSINIAKPRPEEVDSAILYYLYQERNTTPLYDGVYKKDVTIDAGDKISLWYRSYTKEDGKEIDYLNNFDGKNPEALILGEGNLFAHGVELAIVNAGITPNDTPVFSKITEGTVSSGDVVYVSYTELEAGADDKSEKSYKSVRIDLGDTNTLEKFGEGLISAITGATIGGEEMTAQSQKGGKTYNYTKIKVDFVTRCEGEPYTVSGYFPYDFNNASLANKTVYFDIYVQGVVSYETPAFDDAFITEMLKEDTALITVEELLEYPGDNLVEKYRAFATEYLNDSYEESYDTLLEKALWKHYTEKITIKNYPTKKVDSVYRDYYSDIQNRYDASGGVITDPLTGETVSCSTLDQYAAIYLNVNYTGVDWRTTLRTRAENLVRERLILYYIMRKENFVPTAEELLARVEENKAEYLDEYMTQFLAEIHKDRDDYTDEEYAELVEERKAVLFDYFDDEYFKENAYYEVAMEKFKTFVTVKTLDD